MIRGTSKDKSVIDKKKLTKEKNKLFLEKMYDLGEILQRDFLCDRQSSDKKSKTLSKSNRDHLEQQMVETDHAYENNSKLDRYFLRREAIFRQFKPLEVL